MNFNPRSSCEERPVVWKLTPSLTAFQSTLLMRGATRRSEYRYGISAYISIHAPHARSDHHASQGGPSFQKFNPRPSCVERRHAVTIWPLLIVFQSTLLMRGATGYLKKLRKRKHIFQSTLLMRGATRPCLSIPSLF